ncbi:GAF and ANTAR domain-containing protein [Arthrobacter pityocampae]|uniref:GAF and ANTAR domain-containing protein n=1 Tax=Arthrobacter pityocampae TaxID=547334 RepID=UPI001F4ECD1F|nr:GAF and ANTAR domain-containing protein [Arthrobacter pityocampae]
MDLQDLVLDSPDIDHFLSGLAHLAAHQLSDPGQEVFCGVTLLRHRHAETVASSSDKALRLDEIQYSYGDGPCLTAARTTETVYIPDTRTSDRWPEYFAAVAEHGMLSILGIPIPLDGDAQCALNLYSNAPDAFTPEAARAAEAFAREASRSLRTAVRIAHLSDTQAHLSAALESRTIIDLAAGIIMGQNLKLRDIAARVVSTTSNEPPTTHFG